MFDLVRRGRGGAPVTNVELFFGLVYVFAVTQISHYLLGHLNVQDALQAALLLAMTWLVWVAGELVVEDPGADLQASRYSRTSVEVVDITRPDSLTFDQRSDHRRDRPANTAS